MLKRIASGMSALLLSVASLAVFAPALASAAVDVCTWIGGTNLSWNTAANWSCASDGTAVPGNGDSLTFDNSSLSLMANGILDNNISSLSINNITFSGNGSNTFQLTGNAITLTGTINVTATSGAYPTIENDIALSGDKTINLASGASLSLEGNLTGSGNITKTGVGMLSLTGDNSGMTGSITASAGTIVASSKGLANTGDSTFGAGADLSWAECTDVHDFYGDVTLTGASATPSGDYPSAKLTVSSNSCNGGGAPNEIYGQYVSNGTSTIKGAIVLGSDVTFTSYDSSVVLSGALSGNYKLAQTVGDGTKITVSNSSSSAMPNGTYQADILSKTLSDALPNSTVGIYGRTVVTITGTRGNTVVGRGGTLKGTGTVGDLAVNENAYVAPGTSPGCLSSGNLEIYGEYQFEAKNNTACTGYDQLKVTGTVRLTENSNNNPASGTINISFLDKYNPKAGTAFTIISNDGADAVLGTFKNLAEGATFTGPNKSVWKVSYKGGDGNDVVITVVTAGTPDTGFGLLLNNPAMTLGFAAVAAGAIVMMSRRMKPAAKRIRR